MLVTIPPVNGGGYASQSGGRQYYGPDEKLTVVQRYDYRVGSGASLGSWEEYWYDALGRRILTRARRSGSPPTGTGPLCNDPVGNSCQSYYQRTLWDGDQILYEWRVADGTSTGYNSGTAGYVHVEGIDQPVGLIRSDGTRVLNYTWRGLGESSVFTNGAPGDISLPGGSLAVQWPTRTQGGVYFTPNVLASGSSGPFTWFGTLAENGAGSTGLLYRRNRYFDPVSGRFTQADPIGLAGGLNLYGFANGDPVNFTDPFGLCPEEMGGDGRTKSLADCPEGSEGRNRYRSGAVESAGLLDPFLLFGGIQGRAASAVVGRATVPQTRSVLRHIFRTVEGHVNPRTESSRQRYIRLFERVANNPANLTNFRVAEEGVRNGTRGFTQTFRQGEVWVHVNNGRIFDAGVNPFR